MRCGFRARLFALLHRAAWKCFQACSVQLLLLIEQPLHLLDLLVLCFKLFVFSFEFLAQEVDYTLRKRVNLVERLFNLVDFKMG